MRSRLDWSLLSGTCWWPKECFEIGFFRKNQKRFWLFFSIGIVKNDGRDTFVLTMRCSFERAQEKKMWKIFEKKFFFEKNEYRLSFGQKAWVKVGNRPWVLSYPRDFERAIARPPSFRVAATICNWKKNVTDTQKKKTPLENKKSRFSLKSLQ